ncbi:hypothetical protein WN51_02432 [Melipona quadrifasciata]|uniref:Uncharacterized protein n=1 Tax=Melipona quadrifasciata TaxID=166423 RepID=A0A0N0BE91_9HYME|nr:hypothetical protein WN51_02432 [Melipona quadrifasciata]
MTAILSRFVDSTREICFTPHSFLRTIALTMIPLGHHVQNYQAECDDVDREQNGHLVEPQGRAHRPGELAQHAHRLAEVRGKFSILVATDALGVRRARASQAGVMAVATCSSNGARTHHGYARSGMVGIPINPYSTEKSDSELLLLIDHAGSLDNSTSNKAKGRKEKYRHCDDSKTKQIQRPYKKRENSEKRQRSPSRREFNFDLLGISDHDDLSSLLGQGKQHLFKDHQQFLFALKLPSTSENKFRNRIQDENKVSSNDNARTWKNVRGHAAKKIVKRFVCYEKILVSDNLANPNGNYISERNCFG